MHPNTSTKTPINSGVLVVHAYEIYADGTFSPRTTAVCQKVLRIHEQYKRILLIGGWHNTALEYTNTLGVQMEDWLHRHGVPMYKTATHFNPPNTTKRGELVSKRYPPRDTFDEVAILPYYFLAMGFETTASHIGFDIVCSGFYSPRVELIYALHRAKVNKVHRAWSFAPSDWRDLFLQVPWILFTALNKSGDWSLFRKLREKRTPKLPQGIHFITIKDTEWY